jgi:post-segregation antitoxin (ccd killing protein)
MVVRMARANVYLPDDLHERARRADLNVSELTQRAIRSELERRARLEAMAEFLDDVEERYGVANEDEVAAARLWAEEILAVARAGHEGALDDPSAPHPRS